MATAPQQGWSQQTPAAKQIIASAWRSLTGTSRGRKRSSSTARRTKRSKRARSSTKRSKRSGSKKLKRLVKGSAAAKAYMRKIRAKRK